MTLAGRLGPGLPRAPVALELDDIQATALRYRPEPYYGTHIMLHVDEAQAGRELDSGRKIRRRSGSHRGRCRSPPASGLTR